MPGAIPWESPMEWVTGGCQGSITLTLFCSGSEPAPVQPAQGPAKPDLGQNTGLILLLAKVHLPKPNSIQSQLSEEICCLWKGPVPAAGGGYTPHTEASLGSVSISAALCLEYLTPWLHPAPCSGSRSVNELIPRCLFPGQTGGFVGRSLSPQQQTLATLCSPPGHPLGAVGTQGLSCN